MAKIILTTHQKGGVGKSTLTFNMALALNNEVKVCIIDLDLQGSLWRSRTASDIPVFSADEMNDVLKSDFDFIFIDTPPYLNEKLPELAKLANVIVIPTKTGIYDLLAIEDTISIIKDSKSEKKALIVFNMVKPNTTLTGEMHEAMEKHKIPIAKNYISDLVAFTRSAINNEITDQKAKFQIENLTREVLERI
ncbi:conjugal transfer protein TraA [Chryseobacterium angstadtii]|uniref:Conjugal transfer protein TraA n=1 Tax=Chryseobacterium angstadtii TaxID=558151 RepID=A0A0J7HWF7_9FLAO|nr:MULTISPECIES: ParA family protein [Chryseobacterium]KMQ58363.1 conjugal transfer protein TraA [Chryseobacterium angstadtii]